MDMTSGKTYDIFWTVHMRKILFLAVLLLLSSCGKSIEKQTRDQVRKLSNAELNENQIRVFNVKDMGDSATAELEINTAVKMRKQDGNWLVEEIRIGSRKWEDIHRIVRAVDQIRIEDTMADMQVVRDAVRKYRSAKTDLTLDLDYPALIDLLYPEFISVPMREDAWDNPFTLLVTKEGFQIRSTGPDGKRGSSDDLVLNDEK